MLTARNILRSSGKMLIKLSNHFDRAHIYSPESPTSFVFGATAVFDLIRFQRDRILRIYDYKKNYEEPKYREVLKAANEEGIPVIRSANPVPSGMFLDDVFNLTAEFQKWDDRILPGSHVVLVEPNSYFNIGGIMRSSLAFGIHDVAIICKNGFDTFHPQQIRKSMGTRLGLRVESISSIEEYIARFPENRRYAFMLDHKARCLGETEWTSPCSLIFGNETRGLPPEYSDLCSSVFIEQSEELDSLNLSVAAGIALHSYASYLSRAD